MKHHLLVVGPTLLVGPPPLQILGHPGEESAGFPHSSALSLNRVGQKVLYVQLVFLLIPLPVELFSP